MPRLLRALVVVLVLQVVLDGAAILEAWSRISSVGVGVELLALIVDLTMLGLLGAADERARGLLRAAAAVGVAIDGMLVLTTIAWSSGGLQGLVLVGLAVSMFAASGFALWVLGRPEVVRWVFIRWLAAVEGA